MRHKSLIAFFRIGILGVVCLLFSSHAYGRILRLGPFDLDAESELGLVYSSNVEGERPSQATEPREDYYFVAGLNLDGQARMTPNTSIDVDTGIAVERHLRRKDLNDSSNPFGRIRLSTLSAFRRTTVSAGIGYERKSESATDTYVPGNRKTRDPHDVFDYGASIDWRWRIFRADASYAFERERHDEIQFQDGDKDETTINVGVGVKPSKYFDIGYTYEWKKTEEPHNPDVETEWEETENINLNVPITILKRPQLTYSFSLERERGDGKDGKWEPKHNISLNDDIKLLKNQALEISINGSYTIDREDESDDDINFTYGVRVSHRVSRTLKQELSATRQPYNTLGSTEDTDNTTVSYTVTKDDLFIYNLNALVRVAWLRDEPKGENAGPTERKWTADFGIAHSRALTRKLDRIIQYTYSWEDSNLEDEILDEHRVELKFVYRF